MDIIQGNLYKRHSKYCSILVHGLYTHRKAESGTQAFDISNFDPTRGSM